MEAVERSKNMNTSDKIYEHLVSRMQSDKSVDAPADSIKWAKNLFATRAAVPKASALQRIKAILQIDLSPGKAAFGERSGAGTERQMLFNAGSLMIELRISGSAKKRSVRGQVIGTIDAESTIELISEAENYTAKVNELGEFTIEAAAPGIYVLTFTTGDAVIEIEDLNIGK